MKSLKLLFPIILPGAVWAQTPPAVDISRGAISASAVAVDNILPQLSLEAQQARAEENSLGISVDALLSAKLDVEQAVSPHKLMLTEAVAKAYLLNGFQPLWQDKGTEQRFLREYAAFALSGVSAKSAQSLQKILSLDGFARDVVLTDSFLDYLYYNKNVLSNANQWLYGNLGSYRPKAPDDNVIQLWAESVKNRNAAQFVTSLIPKNHVYQQSLAKLFVSSSEQQIGGKGKDSNVSLAKLALNAQRLRLIPSFNNGIFVNIPSYQLYYFRDGQLKLQSKVIVGRDDRRTPVMYSKLSNVVVNPPWNVPSTIKNKDLVPKMRKDPSYAERNDYEILDSQGRKVNPYEIAWENYDGEKNFPYHIRQKAGDDSALGRFKFNMPSSDAIYLHDTPNRGLFNKTARALSSGCVRVAKSDELATILLKEAGWSESRKQSVLDSKKTTSAQIRSDNPVYLYYVTAWVENGQVYTLPDIYKYDKNLPKSTLDWELVKRNIAN